MLSHGWNRNVHVTDNWTIMSYRVYCTLSCEWDNKNTWKIGHIWLSKKANVMVYYTIEMVVVSRHCHLVLSTKHCASCQDCVSRNVNFFKKRNKHVTYVLLVGVFPVIYVCHFICAYSGISCNITVFLMSFTPCSVYQHVGNTHWDPALTN